ncbi:MAG: deferrochelatase/peroxidase EfeB, partial [Nocardioidaceae bacterium]|nr:deferrochelatase/peroxidase EfeB [Nocardioidaceae bacterium]
MTDRSTGNDATSPDAPSGGVSRRRMLGTVGAGVAVGAAGIGGYAVAANASTGRSEDAAREASYAFHGKHQAGIVTPAQDRLHFAAFDVTTTSRDALIALLKAWTTAAAQLTRGEEVGNGAPQPYEAPALDTGEAIGLAASRLTLTFGFGPGLFVKDGVDRFGIASKQPAALKDLPHFPADNLDPSRTGGDLCIQACA